MVVTLFGLPHKSKLTGKLVRNRHGNIQLTDGHVPQYIVLGERLYQNTGTDKEKYYEVEGGMLVVCAKCKMHHGAG